MGLLAILLVLSQAGESTPRITAGSMPGREMTRYVRPVYPNWARRQHIEGLVEFAATIGKDGSVRHLSLIEGPELLVPFARAAIGKWRYKPATLNGERVEVRTAISVNFTLRQ